MGLMKKIKKARKKPPTGIPLANEEFAHKYRRVSPPYKMGVGTYGTPIVHDWNEGTTLSIGAYCSIADDVHIMLGGNHQTDWVSTYPFYSFLPELAGIERPLKTRGDVVIGNDVWLGSGCRIMSGVTIGDGAVVAAGSIVTESIAPYSIVAGIPARHLKFRFDEENRAALQKLRWWDWPPEKVRQAAPLLCSGDVKALVAFI